jgi:hypothetical protein
LRKDVQKGTSAAILATGKTGARLARQEPERRFLAKRLAELKQKSSTLLSIFPLRDDYRTKMQRAKQCGWPEDR